MSVWRKSLVSKTSPVQLPCWTLLWKHMQNMINLRVVLVLSFHFYAVCRIDIHSRRHIDVLQKMSFDPNVSGDTVNKRPKEKKHRVSCFTFSWFLASYWCRSCVINHSTRLHEYLLCKQLRISFAIWWCLHPNFQGVPFAKIFLEKGSVSTKKCEESHFLEKRVNLCSSSAVTFVLKQIAHY
jgi:hypothetical protein